MEETKNTETLYGVVITFLKVKDAQAFERYYGTQYFIYDDEKKRDKMNRQLLAEAETRWGRNEVQTFRSTGKTMEELCEWVEKTFFE